MLTTGWRWGDGEGGNYQLVVKNHSLTHTERETHRDNHTWVFPETAAPWPHMRLVGHVCSSLYYRCYPMERQCATFGRLDLTRATPSE